MSNKIPNIIIAIIKTQFFFFLIFFGVSFNLVFCNSLYFSLRLCVNYSLVFLTFLAEIDTEAGYNTEPDLNKKDIVDNPFKKFTDI